MSMIGEGLVEKIVDRKSVEKILQTIELLIPNMVAWLIEVGQDQGVTVWWYVFNEDIMTSLIWRLNILNIVLGLAVGVFNQT